MRKRLNKISFTLLVLSFCVTSFAQLRMESQIKSILYLGGGLNIPDGRMKSYTNDFNGYNAKLDYFYNLFPLSQRIGLGINLGSEFSQNFDAGRPQGIDLFNIINQTASSIDRIGIGSEKIRLLKLGAGPQLNIKFGQFILSPKLNLGYMMNTSRDSVSFVQTTTVVDPHNTTTFSKLIYSQVVERSSGMNLQPGIRFHYQIGKWGLWFEPNYIFGNNIRVTERKFIPEGNPNIDGQYSRGQIDQWDTYETTTKEIKTQGVGINAGLFLNLSPQSKPSKPTISTAKTHVSNELQIGCDPCTPKLELYVNGVNTTLSETSSIQLGCGTYDILRQLLNSSFIACSSNSATNTTIEIVDANGNVPSWVTPTIASNASYNILTIPAGLTGTYYIRYKWYKPGSNNTFLCGSVDYPFIASCSSAPQPCTCNGNVTFYPFSGGPSISGNYEAPIVLNCNGQYDYGFACIPANTNINFSSFPPKVFNASNVVQNWNANGFLTIPSGTTGSYSFRFYWTNSSGVLCDSMTVPITINCIPQPTCTSSNSFQYVKNGTTHTALCKDSITISPNDLFTSFSKQYTCSGLGSPIQTSSVVIYKPDGTIYYSTNTSSTFTSTSGINFPQCGGSYRVVFRSICGNVICDSCSFKIKVSCPCVCIQKDTIQFVVNGNIRKIACNQTMNVYTTDIINSVKLLVNCPYQPYCAPGMAGVLVNNNTGSYSLNYAVNGYTWSSGMPFLGCNNDYQFSFVSNCGGLPCDTCNVNLIAACPPPPCTCLGWKPLTYTVSGVTGNNSINCGNSITVNDITKTYTFTSPGLNCNSINPSTCTSNSIQYRVYNGNTLVHFGNGATFSYQFTACKANYKVVFKGKCGVNTACDSCTIQVNTDCCNGGKIWLAGNVVMNPVIYPPDQCNSIGGGLQFPQYRLDVSGIPANTLVNYQIIPLPGNGSPSSSGSFNTGAITTVSIPQYDCGIKERVRIICSWNNGLCKDTAEYCLARVKCCEEFTIQSSQKNVVQVGGNKIVRFSNRFYSNGYGTFNNVSKIKVQLVTAKIGSNAGETMVIDQISIPVNTPWPSTAIIGTASPALIPGDAIWFNSPFTVNGPYITFSGQIPIGISNIANNSNTNITLRYTFYSQHGNCVPTICTQDVSF